MTFVYNFSSMPSFINLHVTNKCFICEKRDLGRCTQEVPDFDHPNNKNGYSIHGCEIKCACYSFSVGKMQSVLPHPLHHEVAGYAANTAPVPHLCRKEWKFME